MSEGNENANNEPLVRILKSPHFVKAGGELKVNAFRPQRDTNKISVVIWPQRERPGERFKERCQQTGDTGANTYCGLGVFSAVAAQEHVALEDEPVFPGHANLVFPTAAPRDEPPDGPNLALLTGLALKLIAISAYVPDPDPRAQGWTIVSEILPPD